MDTRPWIPSKWLYWPSSHSKQLLLIFFVALAYYITGSLGLLLAIPNTNVTTVWPPSGIALAAGLFYGPAIWPAVFIGSLINNIIGFFAGSSPFTFQQIVGVSFFIGVGSVLQMLTGLKGIRLLIKSRDLLGSALNIFKFLFVAITSCLVNSTIGSLSLAIGGIITWDAFTGIFWNWWLGDIAGVVVFTPLIWTWFKEPLPILPFNKILEGITLLICLLITAILLIISKIPFIYVLIPFMVWGGVRFSHHGATLLVMLTSLIAILGTERGSIFFLREESLNTSLIFLQSFVGITTVMTLALGAVVQERMAAFAKLKNINQNLENKVKERTHEIQLALEKLKEMQQQIIVQQKLASLGELTAGIAHEIKNPLNLINNFAELSIKQINKLNDFFETSRNRYQVEEIGTLKKILDVISSNNSKIHQYGQRADNIVNAMLSHAHVDNKQSFQLTDLNILLKECQKLAYESKQGKDPTFKVSFEDTFDPAIKKIDLVPQEFSRVIINILDNTFYALDKKKKLLGKDFIPKISMTTRQMNNEISIIIKDNGTGIPAETLKKIFTPFFTTKPPGEGTGLGLSLSYDIIVSMHHGKLEINSVENEWTEVIIILPFLK